MRLRDGGKERIVRMALNGGQAKNGQPEAPASQVSNYFVGAREQWREDVPHFGRVKYHGVYRGVDLVYYGTGGKLEYDFMVEPGASVRPIELGWSGIRSARVTAAGELDLGDGLMERAPVAYQMIEGKRRAVEIAYELRSGSNVGFRVGNYDSRYTLTIDPLLVFSTFIGGLKSDTITAVATDKDGNVYAVGETTSVNFPVVGPAIPLPPASVDGFVMKINPAGNKIIYSSYLGGSSNTRANAITVDANGSAYITGRTGARDFPLVNPVQQTPPSLNIPFIVKLNPAGNQLQFSTFLGGERNDEAFGIALDPAGNVYIAGRTNSTGFPMVNALNSKYQGGDAFVAKFRSNDYRLVYSTYLGGAANDEAYAITADTEGSAYVTGITLSSGLGTAGAHRDKYIGGQDAFIAKISPAGDRLMNFTYVGGNQLDRASTIMIALGGDVVVAGTTASKDLPVTEGAFSTSLNGNYDAFVLRYDNSGSTVHAGTYIGGSSAGTLYNDDISSLAQDSDGSIYAFGATRSADFPTKRPLQAQLGGGQDAFAAKFTPSLDKLIFSTFLGGSGDENGLAMAADSTGAIFVGGDTVSSNFPRKSELRGVVEGTTEGFLTKICDPRLTPSQTGLQFVAQFGQPAPAAQTLTVSTCLPIPATVTFQGAFVNVTGAGPQTNLNLSASVSTANLQPGDYHGKIVVQAADAVNPTLEIPVGLRVSPPPPSFTAAAVTHAASTQAGSVAPGELLVIYGSYLGPDALQTAQLDANGRVTTLLADTRVYFDGIPASMVYTSKGQISVVVPFAVGTRASTQMEIEYKGVKSTPVTMQVQPANPAIFTLDFTGKNQGAILNQDGVTVNSVNTAADKGSVIVIYGTGAGQTNPQSIDGTLADKLANPLLPVGVTIDGQPAELLYAGAAPGLVAGVFQINVKIPAVPHFGPVPVQVTVGSYKSPDGVTVAVR
jgi:uncharacterized protein (TIGR03437 family)